jgi:hypothetical protein
MSTSIIPMSVKEVRAGDKVQSPSGEHKAVILDVIPFTEFQAHYVLLFNGAGFEEYMVGDVVEEAFQVIVHVEDDASTLLD